MNANALPGFHSLGKLSGEGAKLLQIRRKFVVRQWVVDETHAKTLREHALVRKFEHVHLCQA
jgi:hypothetical protein